MAFADLVDNMDVAESMLKYIINFVLESAPEEMKFFNDPRQPREEETLAAAVAQDVVGEAIPHRRLRSHSFEGEESASR